MSFNHFWILHVEILILFYGTEILYFLKPFIWIYVVWIFQFQVPSIQKLYSHMSQVVYKIQVSMAIDAKRASSVFATSSSLTTNHVLFTLHVADHYYINF